MNDTITDTQAPETKDLPGVLDAVTAKLPPLLAIELEGGLLSSKLKDERYWAAQARRFALDVSDERAGDDGKFNGATDPDLQLPFRASALELIDTANSKGRQICLSCPDDEAQIAQRIADKFPQIEGIWPHSYAAEGREYALAGVQSSDHPLVPDAHDLIAIDLPLSGREELSKSGKPVHVIGQAVPLRTAFLTALRPHQWAKNVLVFLPMLAGHVFTPQAIQTSLLAFVAFCLVASSVYVLNDLLDLAADRAHPRKKDRPFAAGALPLAWGKPMALGLLLAGLGLALMASLAFAAILVGYYVLTATYSFFLKRKIIIDICTLAGLYTIRIVAAGAATGIALSVWLLAFSVFFFLALAAIKRQAELVDALARGNHQPAGRGYRAEDLPLISQMSLSASYVAVLVLALYLNTPSVQDLYSSPWFLWGICLILLYWLSRAVMKTHRGEMYDDPVVFALKDRVSRICLLAVLILGGLGAVL